jgi:hypothetical protein
MASGCPVYTPTMTVKSAALFALIGMLVLTILLAAGFLRDLASFFHDLIPALRVLSSAIYFFASFTLTVFFYAFHRSQS